MYDEVPTARAMTKVPQLMLTGWPGQCTKVFNVRAPVLVLAGGDKNWFNIISGAGRELFFNSFTPTVSIFWCTPAEFCWCMYFAGTHFTSKSEPAKFKMHQQSLRCTSKIIDPIFDMSCKEMHKSSKETRKNVFSTHPGKHDVFLGECLLGAISDKFRVGKKVPPPNFFCCLCLIKTSSWHFGCE